MIVLELYNRAKERGLTFEQILFPSCEKSYALRAANVHYLKTVYGLFPKDISNYTGVSKEDVVRILRDGR